jgi:hypothetical protein
MAIRICMSIGFESCRDMDIRLNIYVNPKRVRLLNLNPLILCWVRKSCLKLLALSFKISDDLTWYQTRCLVLSSKL